MCYTGLVWCRNIADRSEKMRGRMTVKKRQFVERPAGPLSEPIPVYRNALGNALGGQDRTIDYIVKEKFSKLRLLAKHYGIDSEVDEVMWPLLAMELANQHEPGFQIDWYPDPELAKWQDLQDMVDELVKGILGKFPVRAYDLDPTGTVPLVDIEKAHFADCNSLFILDGHPDLLVLLPLDEKFSRVLW